MKDYANKKEFLRPLNCLERIELLKELGTQSAFTSENPSMKLAKNLGLLQERKHGITR